MKVPHKKVFPLSTPEIHSQKWLKRCQKPVFALPGCQRMSVNTLLCDTLALARLAVRWPGDSQRESGRFARIDLQKNDSQKKNKFIACEIRANRLKPAIHIFSPPRGAIRKKKVQFGTLKRFARIKRSARICESIRVNRAI